MYGFSILAALACSLLALAPGCRCQGQPGAGASPAASAPAAPPASSAASAASSAALPPELGMPWGAARRGDEIVAVGVRPGGGGLRAVRLRGGASEAQELVGGEAVDRPSGVDVVASGGGLAVRVDARQGRGRWWRAAGWAELGQAVSEEAAGAMCATDAALVGVRGGEGARRWPFGPGPSQAAGEADAPGAASLLCGQRRAYLLRDDGLRSTAQALDAGSLLGPFALEARDDERSFASGLDRDALVLARITDLPGRSPDDWLTVRRWEADAPRPGDWRRWPGAASAGETIELVLGRGPLTALVLVRHEEAAGCKNHETTSAVAELVVVDAERGVVRPRRRLDRWTCGAEPGPFGGGATAGGFVVSWPRGADAACARLGVRHGGLGFVVEPYDEGAPRAGRREQPSDDLLDLGCDEGGCAALGLGRGDAGGCWSAGDERGRRPVVVSYP